MLRFWIVFWLLSVLVEPLLGQTETPTSITKLNDDYWASAKGAGLSGGASPLVSGMDAPYYNPAGIGGIHLSPKEAKKTARYIGFPYVGVAIGEDSVDLQSEFSKTPNSTDGGPTTAAILDAHAGKRQFGRFSFVPGFVVSRFMFNYAYDYQVAAVAKDDDSGLIDAHQRISSGPGMGFSATDPDGIFYLGAYSAFLTREVIKADLTFSSVNNAETRSDTFDEHRKTYTGLDTNVGILWRVAKKAKPSFSLVARHAGDTKFEPSDASDEAVEVEQDVVVGFSASPQLGKWGFFNFVMEADKITDEETAIEKKVRAGFELTIGALFGNNSGFGVRGGVNAAGGSYGFHANLGLVRIQASSFAEDIGVDNEKVIERRYVANISVNVAH